MTPHLSPETLLAALEGTASDPSTAHLQSCAECQGALREFRRIRDALVADGDVPDPEAAFWSQLSSEIRLRTTDAPDANLRPRHHWWPVLATVAAAVLMLVVWRPWSRPAGGDERGTAAVQTAASTGDEASWDTIGDLAATLSPEDIRLAVGTPAEVGIADLSTRERETFVRLLDAEFEGSRQ